MLTLPLTSEQKELRKSVGAYLDQEIVPRMKEFNEACQVDPEVYRAFGEKGWLCRWADTKYGGLEAPFMDSYIITNEIAARGLSAVMTWLHSDVVAPYINAYGSEELKDRYLPGIVKGETILAIAMTEPESGSDLAATKGTLVKDGDDYILNANKIFTSNGVIADLVIVAASTDLEAGAKGLSLVLVETASPGVSRKKLNKLGTHAQDTAEMFFENVRVPQKNLLGEEGAGMKMLMTKLQQERLLASLIAQCMGELAIELAIKYTKERIMFGKPVAFFQNTQFVLADLAAKLAAGRALVDGLAMVFSSSGQKIDILIQSSMAKLYCTELVNEVAGKAMQMHGGYGYCGELPIGEVFLDARLQTVAAGTSEIMKLIIGRAIFADRPQ
ncbi:MAG: acyl-CoA dehydrogenase family protein [Coriobacteriia bacterium]|nr:acyl-CoA dehydrogenase family protein [Coriobacteriia bacterium]